MKAKALKSDTSPRRFVRKVKPAPIAPREYLGHETDGRKTPREPGHVKPVPYIKRFPRRRPEFEPASFEQRAALRSALQAPSREFGWVFDLLRFVRKAREEGDLQKSVRRVAWKGEAASAE